LTDTAAIVQKLQAYRWETSSLALFALKKSAYRHGMSHKFLPKMSDECPRYIFRQDTQLCGGWNPTRISTAEHRFNSTICG